MFVFRSNGVVLKGVKTASLLNDPIDWPRIPEEELESTRLRCACILRKHKSRVDIFGYLICAYKQHALTERECRQVLSINNKSKELLCNLQ